MFKCIRLSGLVCTAVTVKATGNLTMLCLYTQYKHVLFLRQAYTLHKCCELNLGRQYLMLSG